MSRILIAILLLYTSFSRIVHSADETLVDKTAALKVAYLYYFSKFINWPSNIYFESGNMVICAADVSADFAYQLSTINGKRVGELLVRTHVFSTVEMSAIIAQSQPNSSVFGDCHIVYVNHQMQSWYQQNFNAFAEHSVIVAESKEVINQVILIHEYDNKLGFEIEQNVAASRGIKISSKLLNLSRKKE